MTKEWVAGDLLPSLIPIAVIAIAAAMGGFQRYIARSPLSYPT